MAANWVPPHKLIFTFIARWRIIICDTWVKKHDMFFYGEKYQRYWFFILLFLEFKCKVPLISGIHLPKLWSRITDRMILFWYDSLKEENYTCMKMLRHSVLFLGMLQYADPNRCIFMGRKFLSLDYIIEHGQRLTQNSNWYQYWFSIPVSGKSNFHWFWIKRYFSLKYRKMKYWLFEV